MRGFFDLPFFLLSLLFDGPGSKCFMCLLCSLSRAYYEGERRQINCLRAFMTSAQRRSYFDKINWCAIIEGVVVMNL